MKFERRVLLVEDDDAVAAGIGDLLVAEGIDVAHVRSAREVEPAIERFQPHVVLLDVRLPDGSGADVFAALRARWNLLPVIFSSGHVDRLAEVGAQDASRVALLRKPYDSETLFRTIDQLLA